MLSKPIISYQGPVSFSTIDRLLSEFKIASQDQQISFKSYKRVISIMIEALENITKYGVRFRCSKRELTEFCPSCHIYRNAGSIELITKNPVKNEDVERLRSRIDHINRQSPEQLKELYRSTITNGVFSSVGGAGLGLIEIARTAGSNIEYEFQPLSKKYSLYIFRVRVPL
ncbi:MAG: SiaB family protein kinase [Bacteroidales bacterium]